MHNFILKRRPLSYNSCKGTKKSNYAIALQQAFDNYYSSRKKYGEDLYAVIYYFFNKNLDLDTDNISKPVWDCLKGFLFDDDQQIKLRTAGSFDLANNNYNVLDFSGLDGDMVVDLLDAFDNEDHVIYIECGLFSNSMLTFNQESHGN